MKHRPNSTAAGGRSSQFTPQSNALRQQQLPNNQQPLGINLMLVKSHDAPKLQQQVRKAKQATDHAKFSGGNQSHGRTSAIQRLTKQRHQDEFPQQYTALAPKQLNADFRPSESFDASAADRSFSQNRRSLGRGSDSHGSPANHGQRTQSTNRLSTQGQQQRAGVMSSLGGHQFQITDLTYKAQQDGVRGRKFKPEKRAVLSPVLSQADTGINRVLRTHINRTMHALGGASYPKLVSQSLPRQQVSIAQLKRPFKQQRTAVTKSSVIRVRRDLEMADKQLQQKGLLPSSLGSGNLLQSQGNDPPQVRSQMTFQMAPGTTGSLRTTNHPNSPYEPAALAYQTDPTVFSQFQVQTQELFKQGLRLGVDSSGRPTGGLNSNRHVSETDLVTDSQAKLVSQTSENQHYTSSVMIAKPVDPRYPPDQQIVSYESAALGSNGFNHTGFPIDPKFLSAASNDLNQSGTFAGMHRLGQTGSRMDSIEALSNQYRNRTLNMTREQQVRLMQSNQECQVVSLRSSPRLQIQGSNKNETSLAALGNNEGPSTTIFQAGQAQINSDLAMVEASSNMIRQCGVSSPLSNQQRRSPLMQIHSVDNQSRLNGSKPGASAGDVKAYRNVGNVNKKGSLLPKSEPVSRIQKASATFTSVPRASQLNQPSQEKISVKIGVKQPNNDGLESGAEDQSVSGFADAASSEKQSSVKQRKASHEWRRGDTLEPNQLTIHINQVLQDQIEGLDQTHGLPTTKITPIGSIQMTQQNTTFLDVQESKSVALASSSQDKCKSQPTTPAAPSAMSRQSKNDLLDSISKRMSERKASLGSRCSTISPCLAQQRRGTQTPTRDNDIASPVIHIPTAKKERGQSQAGEDLDQIVGNESGGRGQQRPSTRQSRSRMSSHIRSYLQGQLNKPFATMEASHTSLGSQKQDEHEATTDGDPSQLKQRFESSQRPSDMKNYSGKYDGSKYGNEKEFTRAVQQPIVNAKVQGKIEHNFNSFKQLLSPVTARGHAKQVLEKIQKEALKGHEAFFGQSQQMQHDNQNIHPPEQRLLPPKRRSQEKQFGRRDSNAAQQDGPLRQSNGSGFYDLATALEKFKKAFVEKRIGAEGSLQLEQLASVTNVGTQDEQIVSIDQESSKIAFFKGDVERTVSNDAQSHSGTKALNLKQKADKAKKVQHHKSATTWYKQMANVSAAQQLLIRDDRKATQVKVKKRPQTNDQRRKRGGVFDKSGAQRRRDLSNGAAEQFSQVRHASRRSIMDHLLQQRNQILTQQDHGGAKASCRCQGLDTSGDHDCCQIEAIPSNALIISKVTQQRIQVGHGPTRQAIQSLLSQRKANGRTEMATSTAHLQQPAVAVNGQADSARLFNSHESFNIYTNTKHINAHDQQEEEVRDEQLLERAVVSSMSNITSAEELSPAREEARTREHTPKQSEAKEAQQSSSLRQSRRRSDLVSTGQLKGQAPPQSSELRTTALRLRVRRGVVQKEPIQVNKFEAIKVRTQSHVVSNRHQAPQEPQIEEPQQVDPSDKRNKDIYVQQAQNQTPKPVNKIKSQPLQNQTKYRAVSYHDKIKQNIQFDKLPKSLKAKYVEIFRPKELQEMLGTSNQCIPQASKVSRLTRFGNNASMHETDQATHHSFQPWASSPIHSLNTNRQSSQAQQQQQLQAPGRTGSRRPRKKVVIDQNKFASLLNNVNFFKAEKHLFNQKGVKFHKATNPSTEEVFDSQTLKPILYQDAASSRSRATSHVPHSVSTRELGYSGRD